MGGSFHPGPMAPGGRDEGGTGSEALRKISGVETMGGPAVLQGHGKENAGKEQIGTARHTSTYYPE